MANAKLTPGDPLPPLQLPGPGGGLVDLHHQTIAGQTLVLCLGPPDPAVDERLATEAERLASLETEIVRVLPGPPTAADDEAPLRSVFDPENRLPALFGLAGDGLVLVEPSGRIAAVLGAARIDDLLQHARAIHEATASVPVEGSAPVLVVPDLLEPELRARLLEYWEAGTKRVDEVARSDAQGSYQSMKRRADVVLEHPELFEVVKARLGRRLLPMVQKVFAFKVTRMEALRVGCYDGASGGYFKRHRDNSTPFTAHRTFAMSLNLNTGDYLGGELRFPEFGRGLYSPPAGGAVVFSCSLLHEALPVVAGRRFALFTFLYDETGAAHERKMIEQERARGRTGAQPGASRTG